MSKTGNNIIIYGAGGMGQTYYQFLEKHGLSGMVKCFCDRDADSIRYICEKKVLDYKQALDMKLPFLVALRKESADDVVNKLDADGQKYYKGLDKIIVDELHIMNRIDYEREICAIAHIESMDDYFEQVESDSALSFFWNEGICHNMFKKLDLRNVVELACGRGRHVPYYLNDAGHLTLIDILDKNIELCRQRFADEDRISYVVNNGYDLSVLPCGEYTALFTYDSMVHFELMDVASYLIETYRILKPGGRALFHHSNNDADYKASYDNSVEARSFMNKKIFAYLAYRAGFDVLQQEIVDWVAPEIDCLTLVEKK